jgi:phage repressor protein C with HTH and peptisase S24 domain
MAPIVNQIAVGVNTFASPECKFVDMTTLKERARLARERMKLTQEQAAAAIGCQRGTVAMWESDGAKTISGKFLLPAATVYKVNPTWLSSGKGHDEYPWSPNGNSVRIAAYEVEAIENDEGFDPDREVWVPGVDVEVSAGSGRIIPEYVPTKYKQRFTLEWIRSIGASPRNLRIMGVRGDSMERTVFNGDRVVIDTGNTKIISNHVYVIVAGDEVRVKRLFKASDGRIRIVSDNQDKTTYPDEFVDADSDRFLVIGRVVDKAGPGGL